MQPNDKLADAVARQTDKISSLSALMGHLIEQIKIMTSNMAKNSMMLGLITGTGGGRVGAMLGIFGHGRGAGLGVVSGGSSEKAKVSSTSSGLEKPGEDWTEQAMFWTNYRATKLQQQKEELALKEREIALEKILQGEREKTKAATLGKGTNPRDMTAAKNAADAVASKQKLLSVDFEYMTDKDNKPIPSGVGMVLKEGEEIKTLKLFFSDFLEKARAAGHDERAIARHGSAYHSLGEAEFHAALAGGVHSSQTEAEMRKAFNIPADKPMADWLRETPQMAWHAYVGAGDFNLLRQVLTLPGQVQDRPEVHYASGTEYDIVKHPTIQALVKDQNLGTDALSTVFKAIFGQEAHGQLSRMFLGSDLVRHDKFNHDQLMDAVMPVFIDEWLQKSPEERKNYRPDFSRLGIPGVSVPANPTPATSSAPVATPPEPPKEPPKPKVAGTEEHEGPKKKNLSLGEAADKLRKFTIAASAAAAALLELGRAGSPDAVHTFYDSLKLLGARLSGLVIPSIVTLAQKIQNLAQFFSDNEDAIDGFGKFLNKITKNVASPLGLLGTGVGYGIGGYPGAVIGGALGALANKIGINKDEFEDAGTNPYAPGTWQNRLMKTGKGPKNERQIAIDAVTHLLDPVRSDLSDKTRHEMIGGFLANVLDLNKQKATWELNKPSSLKFTDLQESKVNMLLSIASARTTPQFTSVEDTYRRIQIEALGKGPIEQMLDEINTKWLKSILEQLVLANKKKDEEKVPGGTAP